MKHYFVATLVFLFADGPMNVTFSKASESIINIHVTKNKSNKIAVFFYNTFNNGRNKLADAILDSTGYTKVTLKIDRVHYAFIEIDRNQFPIKIAPEADMTVYIDATPSNSRAKYSGIGSATNNYLVSSNLARTAYGPKFVKSVSIKDEKALLNICDSLNKDLKTLNNSYADSIPKKELQFLRQKDELGILLMKMNYRAATFGNDPAEKTISPPLKNLIAKVPLDTSLLSSGIAEYGLILQFYLDIRYVLPLFSNVDKQQKDSLLRIAPGQIDSRIKKSNLNRQFEETFLALNIQYWTSATGISESVDKLYQSFKAKFPRSKYLIPLEKLQDELRTIGVGKIAPEIKGSTIDGREFHLSDLKGKVIYLDIWASWCGPCLKEIPYTTKMLKEIGNSDQLVILNVSVDKNRDSWQRALAKYKTFGGLHVIQDGSIYRSYLLSGVPRYVLIDKKGRIIDPYAPSPSSGKIVPVIKKLLTD